MILKWNSQILFFFQLQNSGDFSLRKFQLIGESLWSLWANFIYCHLFWNLFVQQNKNLCELDVQKPKKKII